MRRLWAVARQTFIECMRSQMTAVFIVALIAAAVIIPVVSRSTTFTNQVQTFLSYSVGIDAMLMSIMTILLTCGIVSREIEKRHVFAPVTKPIPRWQYMVGRWLGVVLLQATLLAACGLTIYTTTQIMRRQAVIATGEGTPAKRKRAMDNLVQADSEVFIARKRLAPSDIDERIQALFQQRVAEWTKNKTYQRGVEIDGKEVTDQTILKWARSQIESTGPDGSLSWRFDNLTKPADGAKTIQLQMKIRLNSALPLETLTRIMILTNLDTGQTKYKAIDFPSDRSTVIPVPADILTEGCSLQLRFVNKVPPGVRLPFKSSVTIRADEVFLLYRVGGFAGNFARAILLTLLLQMFLAALAIAASSWLSFPVACLWCFMLYCVGLTASFLTASVNDLDITGAFGLFSRITSRGVLAIVPDFSAVLTGESLVDGLAITWGHVAMAGGQFVGIWCVVLLAMAGVIFTKRELARVIA